MFYSHIFNNHSFNIQRKNKEYKLLILFKLFTQKLCISGKI